MDVKLIIEMLLTAGIGIITFFLKEPSAKLTNAKKIYQNVHQKKKSMIVKRILQELRKTISQKKIFFVSSQKTGVSLTE